MRRHPLDPKKTDVERDFPCLHLPIMPDETPLPTSHEVSVLVKLHYSHVHGGTAWQVQAYDKQTKHLRIAVTKQI